MRGAAVPVPACMCMGRGMCTCAVCTVRPAVAYDTRSCVNSPSHRARVYIRAHAHAHAAARDSCAHAQIHTHTYNRKHTHIRTHARTRAHTHVHTTTHTHTHTHTHIHASNVAVISSIVWFVSKLYAYRANAFVVFHVLFWVCCIVRQSCQNRRRFDNTVRRVLAARRRVHCERQCHQRELS